VEATAGMAQGKEVWFQVEVPTWITFVNAGACVGVVASNLPYHRTAGVTTEMVGGLGTTGASELAVWSLGTHETKAYFRASGDVSSAAFEA
jgi:hypothetical protein